MILNIFHIHHMFYLFAADPRWSAETGLEILPKILFYFVSFFSWIIIWYYISFVFRCPKMIGRDWTWGNDAQDPKEVNPLHHHHHHHHNHHHHHHPICQKMWEFPKTGCPVYEPHYFTISFTFFFLVFSQHNLSKYVRVCNNNKQRLPWFVPDIFLDF